MPTDEINESHGQGQTNKSVNPITIGSEPVMQSAVDVLTILGDKNLVTLKAKGDAIPNAVSVANIIIEKMMKGNSKIQKITLDTDAAAGIGKMTSTVEIILKKN